MKGIRWSPQSRADLDHLGTFYEAIDPRVAERFSEKIVEAGLFLTTQPFAGPVAIVGDRRKWRVRGTPYVILYHVAETHVRILRVLHVAQDQWAN